MKLIYIIAPLAALIVLVGFPLAIRGMIRNIRDVRSGRKTNSQILKPALLGVGIIFVILLCLIGTMFLVVGNMIGGPGMFKAMGAAKEYLAEQHGKSDQWNVSVGKHVETSTNPPSGYYIVKYRYAGRTRKLKAKHTNYAETKKFEIEEMTQE